MKKTIIFIIAIVFTSIIAGRVLADEPYNIELEWSKGIGINSRADNTEIFAIEDIDDDGIIEAIIGNESGFLNILELENGEWVEDWKTFLSDHAVTSAKVGDLDTDGIKEIIVSTRGGYNGSILIFNAVTGEKIYDGTGFSDHTRIKKLIDVDNDGEMELLLTTFVGYTLRNKTKQNYHAPLWNSAYYPVFPVFADVDNDGITEIIAGNDTWDPELGENIGHTISIFDGSTYELEWEDITLEGRIMALEASDIDKDGVKEIIALNYSLDESTEYISVYNGVTKELEWVGCERTRVDLSAKRKKLLITDIDNDDVNEIIIFYEAISGCDIEIYDGETGLLEWTNESIDHLYYYNDLKILDIDKDGYNEIVLVNSDVGGSRPKIIILDGATRDTKLEIDSNTWLAAFSNVDSDLQQEAIFSDLKAIDCKTGLEEDISYLFNDYSILWTSQIGDIDGDGKKEILFCEDRNDDVIIHIYDGITKVEKEPIVIQNEGDRNYFILKDIEDDGIDEIFIGIGDSDYIISESSREVIWQGTVGWIPLELIDVDNDGELEIISTTSDTYHLRIFDFVTKNLEWEDENILCGSSRHIIVSDIDNDGIKEIIIGRDSSFNNGQLIILDGITKEEEWRIDFEYPNGLEGIAAGDVDGDGQQELLYGTYVGRIFILDGDTKVIEGEFNKMWYLHGLAVGDINGDGENEIVATNGWNDWNYPYIFDGITYEEKWSGSKSLGEEAQGIDIQDVDSDGINEIIIKSKGYLHILGRTNQPPVIDKTLIEIVMNEEEEHSIRIDATDADSDYISFQLKGANIPPFIELIEHGTYAELILKPGNNNVGIYENIKVSVSDQSGMSDETSFTIVVNKVFESEILPAGWNLISIPAIPYDGRIVTVLNDLPVLRNVWGCGDSGFFRTTVFEAGKAYWVYVLSPTKLTIAGQEIKDNTSIELPVKGWHLIGQPLTNSTTISNLKFTNNNTRETYTYRGASAAGWLYGKMWSWDTERGEHEVLSSKNTLDPWKGYWICTAIDNLTMTIEPEEDCSSVRGYSARSRGLSPSIITLSSNKGLAGSIFKVEVENFLIGASIKFSSSGKTASATIISRDGNNLTCKVPENLPIGTYSIIAVMNGQKSAQTKTFTITRLGSTLKGSVKYGRKPLSGVYIYLYKDGKRIIRTKTDNRGRFKIEGLEKGKYTVLAYKRGYYSKIRKIYIRRKKGTRKCNFKLRKQRKRRRKRRGR